MKINRLAVITLAGFAIQASAAPRAAEEAPPSFFNTAVAAAQGMLDDYKHNLGGLADEGLGTRDELRFQVTLGAPIQTYRISVLDLASRKEGSNANFLIRNDYVLFPLLVHGDLRGLIETYESKKEWRAANIYSATGGYIGPAFSRRRAEIMTDFIKRLKAKDPGMADAALLWTCQASFLARRADKGPLTDPAQSEITVTLLKESSDLFDRESISLVKEGTSFSLTRAADILAPTSRRDRQQVDAGHLNLGCL